MSIPITEVLNQNVYAGGLSMSGIQRKRGFSAQPVIKIGSKKIQRTKSKQSLKRIVNEFNYETEPCSINTKDWTDGHP